MDIASYIKSYFSEVAEIAQQLDQDQMGRMVEILSDLRKRQGRLFIIGVGGGAGNASHAVNDFRKIVNIESYTPTDNVSELTARVNDEGWETVFSKWLQVSRLNAKDGILVFSVGGGNLEKQISANIVGALKLAQEVGASILGVVGRDGGTVGRLAGVSLRSRSGCRSAAAAKRMPAHQERLRRYADRR
ncbi:MAG: SIS domain-containing protein [Nitrospinae bacterium]|nr:SIS domain-containing protein [Nitrospinota bacterium]